MPVPGIVCARIKTGISSFSPTPCPAPSSCQWRAAPRAEVSVALMEPRLGPSVELDHLGRHPALASPEPRADVGPVARAVGGLAEHVAHEAVARPGEVAAGARIAARMLRGDQADVGPGLAGGGGGGQAAGP